MHPYPRLAFIDQALDGSCPGFCESPNAAHLEELARQLADDYWSELVWLTGRVPEATFRTVCSVLEQERAIAPASVTLIVAPVITEQAFAAWTAADWPTVTSQETGGATASGG